MPLRKSTLDDYERRILLAQQVIAERIDDDITPAELADAAHFSLHHFHRIFRARLGETVMQHVRRLRLERAARRIKTSTDGLLQIALENGYESHEAFTRAFTDRFGITPSAYREQPSARLAAWNLVRDDLPKAHISVESRPPLRIAYRRRRGGYAGIEEFWASMMQWAGSRGLHDFYGVCSDDTEVTPEDHLRFDACVVVPPAFEPDDTVAIGEIPGGTYAVGIHVGPFMRLSETYLDVIGRWFPKSGYELAPAPVLEHYLDDPAKTPEHARRTEVCVRIAD